MFIGLLRATHSDCGRCGLSSASCGKHQRVPLCRVNWQPGKAAQTLKVGDIISCSGRGRLVVDAVSETKKGKFAVELQRYL